MDFSGINFPAVFVAAISGALKVLMGGEQVLVVIEAIVLYLFLSRRYKASGQGKDSVHLLIFGDMKMILESH